MNVAEILAELGIAYVEGGTHKSVRHGWLGVESCPFCGHGDYYAAFPQNGCVMACWACGSRGFVESLQRLSGKSYPALHDYLMDSDYYRRGPQQRQTGKYTPPQTCGLLRVHCDYLFSRHINIEQAVKLWHVDGTDWKAGVYSWRLFLPVHLDGRPVSWTTRKVAAGEPRYRAAPPEAECARHRHLLYGADLVRGTAIVVEGPMDALRGGPGCVATLGAGYTQEQVARIARFPRRIICYDSAGDATGERMGERLARELAPHPGETEIVHLDAKDLCDCSEKEVRRLRRLYLD